MCANLLLIFIFQILFILYCFCGSRLPSYVIDGFYEFVKYFTQTIKNCSFKTKGHSSENSSSSSGENSLSGEFYPVLAWDHLRPRWRISPTFNLNGDFPPSHSPIN